MSDHWNSLANMLGTPSLAPQKPKTDAPASVAPEKPLEPASGSTASIETPTEKPKVEKSRLKTSWDAVANFFGVTSKDSEQASEPTIPETPVASVATYPKPTGGTPKPTSRRGKPSMWGAVSEESEESEESPKRAPSQREVSDQKEPVRSEGKRRDVPPRDIDKKSEGETCSDSDSVREPERRSHRRPPRRGRDAESRDRDSHSRDVPAVKDRETPRHSDRQEPPAERTVSTRTTTHRSSEPRKSTPSQEPRPAKKSSGFGAGIVGNDDLYHRSTVNSDGKGDTDEFRSRSTATSDECDEPSREELSAEQEQDDRPRRRRRRGGRGRKHRDESENHDTSESMDERAGRTSRQEDSDDQSPDDESSVRHAKIPSWTATISVLVEANMLNHQRSQSTPRGNPRGRGRR